MSTRLYKRDIHGPELQLYVCFVSLIHNRLSPAAAFTLPVGHQLSKVRHSHLHPWQFDREASQELWPSGGPDPVCDRDGVTCYRPRGYHRLTSLRQEAEQTRPLDPRTPTLL